MHSRGFGDADKRKASTSFSKSIQELSKELNDLNQQLQYARNERGIKRPFDYEITDQELNKINERREEIFKTLNITNRINTDGNEKDINEVFNESLNKIEKLQKIKPAMGKQVNFPYGSVVEVKFEAKFKTTKGLFGRTKREKISDEKVIKGRIIGSNITNFTVRDSRTGSTYKSGKDFPDGNVKIIAPSPYTSKAPEVINDESFEDFKKNYKKGDYVNLSSNFEVDEEYNGDYAINSIGDDGRVVLTNVKNGKNFTLFATEGDFTPLVNWTIAKAESPYSKLYGRYNKSEEKSVTGERNDAWSDYYNGAGPYPLESGNTSSTGSFIDA